MNSHNYRFPGFILAERGHCPLSRHGGKFHAASKKHVPALIPGTNTWLLREAYQWSLMPGHPITRSCTLMTARLRSPDQSNSTHPSTAVPGLLACLLLKLIILLSFWSCLLLPFECTSVGKRLRHGLGPSETRQHRHAKTLRWIPSGLIAPSYMSALYFPVARR